MKHFRILMTLVLFMCASAATSLASAQMVQVSDLGAERFVERVNFYGGKLRQPVHVDKPLHIGMMRPDSPYDIYMTGMQKVVLCMFCNQAGYVSKITIQGVKGDNLSLVNATKLCALSMMTLGMSKSECDVLFGRRLKEQDSADVWCNATNRRIVLKAYPYASTFVIRFTAYDR